MIILAVDVGTTGLKMGVFRSDGSELVVLDRFSQHYPIRTYNDGRFSDIAQSKWQQAIVAGAKHLGDLMGQVEVVSLSGTTPGLTAMDAEGTALYPAILMLDQRSVSQAEDIIRTIGLDTLMAATGNMPVAGGCSLASILWLKEHEPDVFAKTHVFGHSNTFVARWLTGAFAIDPSSASLTALYNTAANDLTWNADIAGAFGLSVDRLPPLLASHESCGRVRGSIALELGLRKEPPVVIGGNDAVLAAYSVGIEESGAIINVNGTCEISLVCLPRCISSTHYNVRTHVIPGRWLTLHVMNAGGKALEWFRNLFCRELKAETFFKEFLPQSLETWIDRTSGVTYVPYLMGSRYSRKPLRAEFKGLTQETSREEILAAIVRGLCEYQREHLTEIGHQIPLQSTVHVTGGALNETIIRAKKRWMQDAEYVHEEQSSLRGAALLGKKFLEA